MALIKCPDCGKEVSDRSGKCIYCGCPISNPHAEDENTIKEKENKIEDEYIVGYRAFGPGGIIAIYILAFILGIIINVIAVLLITLTDLNSIKYIFLLFCIPGLSAMGLGIWFFITIRVNNRKNKDCIIYDPKEKKLHLYPLYKDEIIISPNDYIELKDNFNTNNILLFTYNSHDGYKTKVSLGFCLNRSELRERMQEVINDCNKN